MPTSFPPEIESQAAEIASAPGVDPDGEARLQLTHLRSLAIDESSTFEVDDAVSVEVRQLAACRAPFWVSSPAASWPLFGFRCQLASPHA